MSGEHQLCRVNPGRHIDGRAYSRLTRDSPEVGIVSERVPTEVAHDSDFLGGWFQVRLVERTWPVRQLAFAGWAREHPVLVDWIWTLQSPVPQTFDNRKSSGTGLRKASVLQSPTCCMTIERMTWMSLLKIDVPPLEAQQLPNSKARE